MGAGAAFPGRAAGFELPYIYESPGRGLGLLQGTLGYLMCDIAGPAPTRQPGSARGVRYQAGAFGLVLAFLAAARLVFSRAPLSALGRPGLISLNVFND